MQSMKKFAAFVITRDRVVHLAKTIEVLQQQKLPPELILIVDNSEGQLTRKQFAERQSEGILYHHTGYNAGPAGAAYTGMQMLFEQGFEWVMWVDDDDPPYFEELTASLFEIVDNCGVSDLGMVGAVGERFIRSRARLIRYKDNELKGYLPADTISGNMFPLVNRRVYEAGILPDPRLFFGFEELDFGLSLKRKGFQIMVSGELIRKQREYAGRIGIVKPFYKRKRRSDLWREYYGLRNLIQILLKKEKSVVGFIYLLVRAIIKSFYGFRFGFSYGFMNLDFLWAGMADGIMGRTGMTVIPVKKKLV